MIKGKHRVAVHHAARAQYSFSADVVPKEMTTHYTRQIFTTNTTYLPSPGRHRGADIPALGLGWTL